MFLPVHRHTAYRHYPRRARRLRWMILAGCLIQAVAGAEGGRGTREAMADAMTRMMDAMGMFRERDSDLRRPRSDGKSSNWASASSPFSSWSGFPAMSPFSMPGQTPWSSFPLGMGGLPGMSSPWDPSGWSRQMPGFGPGDSSPYGAPWGAPYDQSPLEGSWESPAGELLLIEGSHYRMYSGDSRYLDGRIRVEGDRLLLYNPEQENALAFEYVHQDGRLMLRDEAGQVYLYRRIFRHESPSERRR